MSGEELYWVKVGAVSQVLAALATFLAVFASLFIAFHAHRPRMRLKVGKRVIIGGDEDIGALVMFEVANAGERPIHVRGIGWRTGWLQRGPKCLQRKSAVQLAMTNLGKEPPYEIQPGAAISSYQEVAAFVAGAHERKEQPLFTRDWPIWGRRATRIRAYAYTAAGHTIYAKPEKSLLAVLAQAEIDALAS